MKFCVTKPVIKIITSVKIVPIPGKLKPNNDSGLSEGGNNSND
jgi:hypothetical protein